MQLCMLLGTSFSASSTLVLLGLAGFFNIGLYYRVYHTLSIFKAVRMQMNTFSLICVRN